MLYDSLAYDGGLCWVYVNYQPSCRPSLKLPSSLSTDLTKTRPSADGDAPFDTPGDDGAMLRREGARTMSITVISSGVRWRARGYARGDSVGD